MGGEISPHWEFRLEMEINRDGGEIRPAAELPQWGGDPPHWEFLLELKINRDGGEIPASGNRAQWGGDIPPLSLPIER